MNVKFFNFDADGSLEVSDNIPANEGHVFTREAQTLAMGSMYNSLETMIGPDASTRLPSLYEMIKDSQWEKYLGKDFFPDISIMEDGRIFMNSRRYVNPHAQILDYFGVYRKRLCFFQQRLLTTVHRTC